MKADAEKGDGVSIKDKYGVQGFPCTLILAPNGKLKGQIDGYVPVKEFPARISEILLSK
jgi:thioredoxin-related protein